MVVAGLYPLHEFIVVGAEAQHIAKEVVVLLIRAIRVSKDQKIDLAIFHSKAVDHLSQDTHGERT